MLALYMQVQHRRGEEQEWVVKGRGSSESLSVQAGRPHRAGETVAMDFGPGKTDSQVALDYGCFDDTTRGVCKSLLALHDHGEFSICVGI